MDLKTVLLVLLAIIFVVLFSGLVIEAFYYAVLITLVLVFLGLIGGILNRIF